jgi:imidazolonepropionase-like amidohydrolase
MLQRLAFIILAGLLCAAPQRAQGLGGAGVSIVLTHVTVIDTTGGPAQSDMTVVIDGDRITRVDKKHHGKVPKMATEIDATGKYLIPGLWDMHVHTFFGN